MTHKVLGGKLKRGIVMSNTATLKDNHLYINYEIYDYGYRTKQLIKEQVTESWKDVYIDKGIEEIT